jgi:hypothetical protein
MRLPGIPAIHGGEEVRISRSGRRRVMAALCRLRHAKKSDVRSIPPFRGRSQSTPARSFRLGEAAQILSRRSRSSPTDAGNYRLP